MYIIKNTIGIKKKRGIFGLLLVIIIFGIFWGLSLSAHAQALKAPKGVLANGVGRKIVISWEPAKGADAYEIYERSAETGGYQKIKKTKKCFVVLPEHKRGREYHYKLRAVKKGLLKEKYSGWSKVVTATVAQKGSKTTLKNFLNTAMAPVGSTMYIWGGGWSSKWRNKGSDGAWIGLNPNWRSYASGRSSSFNYRKVRYKTGYGLDCSGFVGWAVYNVMNTKSATAGKGYVNKSTTLASRFAGYGWGSYRKASAVRDYRAGDIMSTSGHVYIVIGQCKDGSVVLVHSSPPGVQICGTATKSGNKDSQAVKIARKYRKKYFSDWHSRFTKCDRPSSYVRKYNQFRWYLSANHVMSDPDGYRNMTPEEILNDLLMRK